MIGTKPPAVSRCILAPAWRRQIPATFAKVHLTGQQADQQMLQRFGVIGLLQDRDVPIFALQSLPAVRHEPTLSRQALNGRFQSISVAGKVCFQAVDTAEADDRVGSQAAVRNVCWPAAQPLVTHGSWVSWVTGELCWPWMQLTSELHKAAAACKAAGWSFAYVGEPWALRLLWNHQGLRLVMFAPPGGLDAVAISQALKAAEPDGYRVTLYGQNATAGTRAFRRTCLPPDKVHQARLRS